MSKKESYIYNNLTGELKPTNEYTKMAIKKT